MQDVLNNLNGSSLGSYGDFSLDDQGRILFKADPASPGATMSVTSDSSRSRGHGRQLLRPVRPVGRRQRPARRHRAAGPDRGRQQAAARPPRPERGDRRQGRRPRRPAAAPTPSSTSSTPPANFGKDGKATVALPSPRSCSAITGADAARASTDPQNISARLVDAQTRRDNFGGVNIDEELSQMVIPAKQYSAAARVITTTSDMYQTLVNMVSSGVSTMNRVATIPRPIHDDECDPRARSPSSATSLEQLQTGKKANGVTAELGPGHHARRPLGPLHRAGPPGWRRTTSQDRIDTQLQYYSTGPYHRDAEGRDRPAASRSDRRDRLRRAPPASPVRGAGRPFAEPALAAQHQRVRPARSMPGSQTAGNEPTTSRRSSRSTDLKTDQSRHAGQAPSPTIRRRPLAQVGDEINMQYGITASDVGTNLTKSAPDAGGCRPVRRQAHRRPGYRAMKSAIDQLGAGIH